METIILLNNHDHRKGQKPLCNGGVACNECRFVLTRHHPMLEMTFIRSYPHKGKHDYDHEEIPSRWVGR
jgi:hypothetical protein